MVVDRPRGSFYQGFGVEPLLPNESQSGPLIGLS